MPKYRNPVRNVILDVESQGLGREAPIHQLALLELDRSHVTEWLLQPYQIVSKLGTKQDLAGLVSSALDEHRFQKDIREWEDARLVYLRSKWKMPNLQREDLEKFIRERESFMHKTIKEVPYLRGGTASPQELRQRQRRLAQFGVSSELGVKTTAADLLAPKSEFLRRLEGRVLWVANLPYESKLLGALVAALEGQGKETGIRELMATHRPDAPDPFYITGREANIARVQAQLSGDWRKIFQSQAYMNPVGPGVHARDIQDLGRALHSYGYHLGFTNIDKPYAGVGVDMASKLMFPRRFLGFNEKHLAAEDAAIHERALLQGYLGTSDNDGWLHTLEKMTKDSKYRAELMSMARKGQGPLPKILSYFQRRNILLPKLEEQNFTQAIGRAYKDITMHGETYVTSGGIVRFSKNVTFGSTQTVDVPYMLHNRKRFTTVDDVFRYVRGSYSLIDPEKEYASFKQAVKTLGDVASYEKSKDISSVISNMAEELVKVKGRVPMHSFGKPVLLKGVKMPALGWMGMAAALGLTGYGAVGSLFERDKRQARDSVVTFDYDQWLERQGQLSKPSIAKTNRRLHTDFGSPYNGPITSNYVLMQQELLRERERVLRNKYGAVHYDPVSGLFGALGPFKRTHYSFIGQGRPVKDYGGTIGNLRALDLDRYKVIGEDADTVILKRRGIAGLVSRAYTFRLAGVDSPEIRHAHGPGSRKAQPYADTAAAILRSMIKKAETKEIIFDPGQITYGRMLGSLILDGKNVNYELIKQGAAAHLPYEKLDRAMVNYAYMASSETRGFNAKRGMWAEPWARAFRDSQMGQDRRVTFNVLGDPSRVAESTSAMSMLSLMEQAQAQGQYSTAHQIAAADIAKFFRAGSDIPAPAIFPTPTAHHREFMGELSADTVKFMQTKGEPRGFNNYARAGLDTLNRYLVLDSMQSSNSPWNVRPYYAYERYGTLRRRRASMAAAQREALAKMQQSPINHHVM